MANPILKTRSVNDPQQNIKRSQNQFDMSYDHLLTARYGDATPIFVMEGVEKDFITLFNRHMLRTQVMKSPLMTHVNVSKDYFAVPLRAIYKHSFENYYTQPTQGDDIPSDVSAYMKITDFITFLGKGVEHITALANAAEPLPVNSSGQYTNVHGYMRAVILLEKFLSEGSLLSLMGYKLGNLFEYLPVQVDGSLGDNIGIDGYIDTVFIPFLRKYAPAVRIYKDLSGSENAASYDLVAIHPDYLDEGVTASSATKYVSIHRFIELLREYPVWTVETLNNSSSTTAAQTDIIPGGASMSINTPIISALTPDADCLNIERLAAYQLVMYHYYVNPQVDFIFTSDKFRTYLETCANYAFYSVTGSPNVQEGASGVTRVSGRLQYPYNGTYQDYDIFSNAYLNAFIHGTQSYITSGTTGGVYGGFLSMCIYPQSSPTSSGGTSTSSAISSFWKMVGISCYWYELFSLKRSLRFGDYFTGSHPTQLAVGSVNTVVTDNSVNTLDMSRNLMLQRFLNAANRGYRTLEDYVKRIFGTVISPDPHNPRWLAHTASGLQGTEIENTGENTGEIKTIFRNQDGQYAFQFDVNEPCILLGIMSFEAKRIYSQAIDRFAFKKSRFDMFNPMMQYAGDQAVFRTELNGFKSSGVFAYALRNMEYKQRYSIASGAFVNNLKSYAFITDNDASGTYDQQTDNIDSEYIRSQSAEFDRFMQSMTGYSLATYYHFELSVENNCEASRAMEFAPSIL